MNKVQKLSVIIPAYNEERYIYTVMKNVSEVKFVPEISTEVIVVDDASADETFNEIERFKSDHPDYMVKSIRHQKNRGKGAAIHTGIENATGDYIIIQDADFEYDPQEYNILLEPVMKGVADVVYGSRFIGGNPHRILFFWHSIGNAFLTFLSNMFTNLNLTDMETCYKLFRADLLKNLKLKEKRFGFEPEVTAKISRVSGVRIYEVGISYYGRTYQEGKKINWKDGLRAIYCIVRYGIFR